MEIKTDNSFLKVYQHNLHNLVLECIHDLEPHLLKNPPIYIFGKEAIQHRDIAFFSNTSIGYNYSNQLAKSVPLTNNLYELLDRINKEFNTEFNGILVNKYKDGNDYIGAHSDDETNLDPIGVICISSGVNRIFRIRDKKTKKIIKDIYTDDNFIIHMGGDFQKEFTHEIPIQKKIELPRYSFTFRKHNK
jgi:alkylated DNA repair dioxygenase AlkB